MGDLKVPVGLDISDADAAVGDVKDPKTFYAGAVPKKTGTIPTVALVAGSNAYPAGYHAGDGGGLDAIDLDLIIANIKSGITIFGVAGHTDVRNVSDADVVAAEVRTGKTFYAVGGAKKTGSGTKTLSPTNDTVQAGYYVATTLSAVETDLVVGNIKQGVNIFGFVGTYAGETMAFTEETNTEIAGGASYTPGVAGIFVMVAETDDMIPQYDYATGEWYHLKALVAAAYKENAPCIGDGTHFRVLNVAGARDLLLMRAYVANMTYERYATEVIPADGTYTPTDSGFFVHGDERVNIIAEMNLVTGGWEQNAETDIGNGVPSYGWLMGDGSNLRYFGSSANGGNKIVVMRAG